MRYVARSVTLDAYRNAVKHSDTDESRGLSRRIFTVLCARHTNKNKSDLLSAHRGFLATYELNIVAKCVLHDGQLMVSVNKLIYVRTISLSAPVGLSG